MAASKGMGKSGAKKAATGFNTVAAKIAKKSNVSPQAARAILASSTRNASPAAKKANPNLKGVLPKKKGK